MAADFPLQCQMSKVPPATFQLGTAGYVVARAVAKMQNPTSGTTKDVHFWAYSVIVGKPIYSQAIGDDMCPGYGPFSKHNIGIGRLSDAAHDVVLSARIGAQACSNATIVMKAGSWIDTWTFDDRPQCADYLPKFASWTADHASLFSWTTSYATIVSLDLLPPAKTRYRALSVSEGSPAQNPNNACGAESATITNRIMADVVRVDTGTGQVPASLGMGHLVTGLEGTFEATRPTTVALQVASNFAGDVTTGGCCGDAILVVFPDP